MIEVHELVFWGAFGLLTELCFTAVREMIQNEKMSMIGHTSLWMFPIYAFGLTYGFDFAMYVISDDTIRYLTYPLWIWSVELFVGLLALKLDVRIWDYRYLPRWAHWRGIISFVHYPLWVVFGILVEWIR
jgi:hypothetical protein